VEVNVARRFSVQAKASNAWKVLENVYATAACMPGAQITEQVADKRYKGVVKSKVGPAHLTFDGELEVLALDSRQRQIRMLGKGAEKSGSTVTMTLIATIEDEPDRGASVLVGEATINVGGKLAQFGSRLLIPVMDALLVQFAKNFTHQALALDASDANPHTPGQTGVDALTSSSQGDATASLGTSALNVFALFWGIIKRAFAQLLGRRNS